MTTTSTSSGPIPIAARLRIRNPAVAPGSSAVSAPQPVSTSTVLPAVRITVGLNGVLPWPSGMPWAT